MRRQDACLRRSVALNQQQGSQSRGRQAGGSASNRMGSPRGRSRDAKAMGMGCLQLMCLRVLACVWHLKVLWLAAHAVLPSRQRVRCMQPCTGRCE